MQGGGEIPLRSRRELAELLKMGKNARKRHYEDLKKELGPNPPRPINPLISLGHQGYLVDSPLVNLRGTGNSYPYWYNILNSEMARPGLEPAVKAKLWAAIVSWEKLFVRAPPHLHYRKITEYLPSATILRNFPNYRFSILRLNEKGKDVIRSLIFYLKDSLKKGVTHSGVDINDIYVNGVGVIQVNKPDGIKGENEDDYIASELAIFTAVILQIVGGEAPSDLAHLLALLNVNSWKASHMFILNHPCLWSARKVEGVIGGLRNICLSDTSGNDHIRRAMRDVDFPLINGEPNWIKVWNDRRPDIGFSSCLQYGFKLSQKISEGRSHLDHSNMLFFLRNQFVHGHEDINHDKCRPGNVGCYAMSGKRICEMVDFYFPQFLSKFVFNVFSGEYFTEEMMNILFC